MIIQNDAVMKTATATLYSEVCGVVALDQRYCYLYRWNNSILTFKRPPIVLVFLHLLQCLRSLPTSSQYLDQSQPFNVAIAPPFVALSVDSAISTTKAVQLLDLLQAINFIASPASVALPAASWELLLSLYLEQHYSQILAALQSLISVYCPTKDGVLLPLQQELFTGLQCCYLSSLCCSAFGYYQSWCSYCLRIWNSTGPVCVTDLQSLISR